MIKRFKQFLAESEGLPPKMNWDKNPKIGWWKDKNVHVMYHGTHESNLAGIAKHGLSAPDHGPTAGNVSMTHDPHTAHGYASMTGGESSFRAAGGKATTVPHHERVVVVHHIPKAWADKNMNQHLRGNTDNERTKMSDKSRYDQHVAEGKPDHEYYQKTELRFKKAIPSKFIVGYMKRYDKQ